MNNPKLLTSGDPSLAYKSVEVKFEHIRSARITSVIESLKGIMVSHNLDILPASVAGVNIRLIVIKVDTELGQIVGDVLINPEIIDNSIYPDAPEWETSVVMPGYEFRVPRPNLIGISYFDSSANRKCAVLAKVNARLMAQQVSYLSGMTPFCQVIDPVRDVRVIQQN